MITRDHNAPAFGTPSYLKRGKGELISLLKIRYEEHE